MRKSTVFKAFVAVPAAVASVQVSTPEVAEANNIHPAGCQQWAYSNVYGPFPNWASNCWVGPGYVTNARMVYGIQSILQSLTYYRAPLDQFWGPATDGALRHYQSLVGLPADGVVGPATWKQLQQELHLVTSIGFPGDAFYLRIYSSGVDFGNARFWRDNAYPYGYFGVVEFCTIRAVYPFNTSNAPMDCH